MAASRAGRVISSDKIFVPNESKPSSVRAPVHIQKSV